MKSYDFYYDGLRLSDLGYIICSFDDIGVETISNGSQISFNTVPTLNGEKHERTNSKYEECLEATFQICKHPCFNDETEISIEDVRNIMRWLNRKGFHKFKLLDDEYLDTFFEASFNVGKIEINGKIRGFELEMFTNRPFALHEPIRYVLKNLKANDVKRIVSTSDEEGFIYPDMTVEILQDGDFEITNLAENRVMRIANCKAGETITINYPVIMSSMEDHKVQNDFNWVFFRISTTFRDKNNDIAVSLPCNIELRYSPVIKIGI